MSTHILITGGTDGIGKLTAATLVAAGHTVYLHGRSQEKVDRVVQELGAATGSQGVVGLVADLSDLTAVSQLVDQVQAATPHLDVLINNAGVFKVPQSQTPYGVDVRLVVNCLAPYLLTTRLLPTLQAATAPRIINLSSAAQAPVTLPFLTGTEGDDFVAYAQSKLALTMWSRHLAQTEPTVTTIPINPGSLLNTNMVKEAFGNHRSSADKGADILVDLATNDIYSQYSGNYFDNDQGTFSQAHPDAYDAEKIAALVQATDQTLEALLA